MSLAFGLNDRSAARGRGWPALCLAGLWLLAFALACRLSAMPGLGVVEGASVMDQMLGAGRVALGARFYERADAYFHKGVDRVVKRGFDNGLTALGEAVRPTRHEELRDTKVNEMMPWLSLTTALDPQNIEGYMTAVFWLAGEGHRPDLAEQVLLEAQRNNPRDYRVYMERGRFYVKHDKLDRARLSLDQALRLWPHPVGEQSGDAVTDLQKTASLRAVVAALEGEPATALPGLRLALSMRPDYDVFQYLVRIFETGEGCREWAERTHAAMIAATAADEHVCAREQHGEDHVHGPECAHEHGHEDEPQAAPGHEDEGHDHEAHR